MVGDSNPKIIQIDGLTMEPLQLSDLDSLTAIWSDPEVTRFLPSRGKPIPREKVERASASFVEHWEKRDYGIWKIVEDETDKMLGYCGLRYLDELNEVELLYGLAKTHWGKGIATKAAKASVSYGFNEANLNRIIALALPENEASKKVIEKTGFKYEKQIHIFNLDGLYYSIER
ncbi:putative acetyltransferase [Calothrix parasitica NIES-267]|uniref:Putative acetyltransferase n=1 Tax=Calothrix parasitica NIES-267 TaxID=1973488 RepID=A0A1Z4LHD1_9CYAN|nr:putative acetyltransferase [Calothrix parasitica NIES-267]